MKRGIVSDYELATELPILKVHLQNFWVRDHRQVYLIGNPLVWWSTTLAVLTYIVARGLIILRAKRQFKDLNSSGSLELCFHPFHLTPPS